MCICFLQPILQLSKKSSFPTQLLRFLYLRASAVRQHKFNRIRVAALRYETDPEVGLRDLRAYVDIVTFLCDWLKHAARLIT